MSSLERLRGRSPQKSPPKSPTSYPRVRPPDATISSTLPYLRDIYGSPGDHNSASYLGRVFTEYLRLQHDISPAQDGEEDDVVSDEDKINLQKLKDMINLTKTIRGIPGHATAKFHVINSDIRSDCVNRFWTILIPTYHLSPSEPSQRPTLDLAHIRLLDRPATPSSSLPLTCDALSPTEYEHLLLILLAHIMRILGSDSLPLVMRPVVTAELRGFIEPLTRMGKMDRIEFPAVDGGERPRFRLLGLANREVRRRGWTRGGEFGWEHVPDEGEENTIEGLTDDVGVETKGTSTEAETSAERETDIRGLGTGL
jgi:hypothetical protein